MVSNHRPIHPYGSGRWFVFSQKSETGFTLAELIVAIIVVSIMVISISELFLGINRSQRQTSHIESATRAGVRQIESLRNSSYVSLAAGTVIDFSAQLPSSIPNPRTATATITLPTTDLRRIEILITFPDGQATRQVRLTSVIGNLGIIQ